jgi:hypothetical protein
VAFALLAYLPPNCHDLQRLIIDNLACFAIYALNANEFVALFQSLSENDLAITD